MGANFCAMSLDGALDRAAVSKAFAEEQAQDAYENGHSYSGGFAMARGLRFITSDPGDKADLASTGYDAEKHEPIFEEAVPFANPFPTAMAANLWLSQHTRKWHEAYAVRYRDKDKAERWMIGASCAS